MATDIMALTPREKEVLALVQRGYTNPQIADELEIADETVKSHVANIMSKMFVKHREELYLPGVKASRYRRSRKTSTQLVKGGSYG